MAYQHSLLHELRTLKGLPVRRLAEAVRSLALQNLDLFDEIKGIAMRVSGKGLFPVDISRDRERVVRAALLAAVADDIGTLPAERSRIRHLGRLDEVCGLLGIRYEDVHDLLEFLPAMQPVLDSRPGPVAGGE